MRLFSFLNSKLPSGDRSWPSERRRRLIGWSSLAAPVGVRRARTGTPGPDLFREQTAACVTPHPERERETGGERERVNLALRQTGSLVVT